MMPCLAEKFQPGDNPFKPFDGKIIFEFERVEENWGSFFGCTCCSPIRKNFRIRVLATPETMTGEKSVVEKKYAEKVATCVYELNKAYHGATCFGKWFDEKYKPSRAALCKENNYTNFVFEEESETSKIIGLLSLSLGKLLSNFSEIDKKYELTEKENRFVVEGNNFFLEKSYRGKHYGEIFLCFVLREIMEKLKIENILLYVSVSKLSARIGKNLIKYGSILSTAIRKINYDWSNCQILERSDGKGGFIRALISKRNILDGLKFLKKQYRVSIDPENPFCGFAEDDEKVRFCCTRPRFDEFTVS